MITCDNFLKSKNGEKYKVFTLTNASGAYVQVTELGASVVSICVPDKYGKFRDVALSFSTAEGFLNGGEYFGATVGRCCGRINGGSFLLGDKKYQLTVNNPPNHLHGGFNSFPRRKWNCEICGNVLEATIKSPDGEEGYPGNLSVKVCYSFTDDNKLIIEYSAVSDRDTVCNLTNHTYFNLNGHNSGSVLGHLLSINSDSFLQLNGNLIPTGEIKSVSNTPFDFRTKKTIGCDILSNDEQLFIGNGYDHCFILNGNNAAFAYGENSGIALRVWTTQPAVQLYTANFVDVGKRLAKGKSEYKKFSGFCLETQGYPDAVNHPGFPSVILKEGDTYRAKTEFAFSVI